MIHILKTFKTASKRLFQNIPIFIVKNLIVLFAETRWTIIVRQEEASSND